MSKSVEHDRTLASRYALQREIGRGGMGVVYRARDLKYDRAVAVKFLSPDATGHLGAERFAEEIRTTARLRHPNILQVDDSDEADGELFYVMPYVEGLSLRDRLDRGPRLTVHETLRIARQVTAALAYAHTHGIIHRDIKPDNILLGEDDHVYVADFGLAHVLARSESARLTRVGMTIGTPAYMSPEQATSEPVDGRSDLYSLGCVLFEMLAGEPPFPGPDAADVMRRQVVDQPPSLRRRRADLPPSVDRLVSRLLEKRPPDRFPTAHGLCEALDAELAGLATGSVATESTRRWTTGRVTLAVCTIVALAWLGWFALAPGFGSPDLDPDRWLVLPLQWQSDAPAGLRTREDALLHAAFARWGDLDLAPQVRATQGSAAGLIGPSPRQNALSLAREARAGRVVEGLATLIGDSIHLDLRASDAVDGTLLARVSARVPVSAERDAPYALLADSLLFGNVSWDGEYLIEPGTRSAAARAAYGAGRAHLARWEPAAAESAFARAIAHDPAYAAAHLWLAQITSLYGGFDDGRAAAALADTSGLTTRERLLADGLGLQADGAFPEACDAFERVTARDERDFFGWFGLGTCHTRDPLVVRDRGSPSGWRFRSSRRAAIAAYVRALTAEPGSHRAFGGDGYEYLRDLLFTRSNNPVRGFAFDGTAFLAQPELHDDTLVVVPRPWSVGQSAPTPDAERKQAAIRAQRLIFLRVAETWAERHPTEADALHALALAQDMLADPVAVETLEHARARATTERARRDLAYRAVWTRLKFSAADERALGVVRVLADSLLATHDGTFDGPDAGEALALLLGRPAVAASFARQAQPAVSEVYGLTAAVMRPGAALFAFAAAGAPADSIAHLEATLLGSLRHATEAEQRDAALQQLSRAVLLGAPAHAMRVFEEPDALGDPTAAAWAALHRGDTATARRVAAERGARFPDGVPSGRLTLDVLYSQAALYAAMGDTASAVAWLDPTLGALEWLQPGVLEESGNAAALVRAFALRAAIAHAAGDLETASRFAGAVLVLWRDGEPAVAPLLGHMRALRTRALDP